VLEKGRVIACGGRDEIFGRPPNRATARLTGCKNFSRARALPEKGLVEATDWGCSLQVTQTIPATLGHIAIRAHHVGLDMPSGIASSERNCLPVWMTASMEGPFRVTLYLRFNGPSATKGDHHLQVEMTREKWMTLRSHPLPWIARLDPDRLFLLSD
jgi:molybdate transport system permease protein